ncbi:MAG: Ig-like domain-containing protein, partial [Venatoribacter sp.]
MTKIINSLLVNKLIAAMLIVGTSVALVGCGADEQSVDLENWAGSAYSPSANLYFSYPINGQQEVMPKTPIVLSFLSKVDTDNAQFSLQSQTEGASKTIALRIRNTADKGNSLVLEPEEALAENTTYQVQMQGVQSQFGLASLPAGGIQFTTRPA